MWVVFVPGDWNMPSICQGWRASRCVCRLALSRICLGSLCVPSRLSVHTTSHAAHIMPVLAQLRVELCAHAAHICLKFLDTCLCGSHMHAPQCHITFRVCDMHTTQQMYIKNMWFVSTFHQGCAFTTHGISYLSSFTYHLHVRKLTDYICV